MEPIKVTFQLASPLFLDSEYPIHLDALLAYACSKDLEAGGNENCWDSEVLDGVLCDYLDKSDVTSDGQWVWKASRLLYKQTSELIFTNQIRKADPERFYQNFFCEENPDGAVVKRFMKDGSPAKVNPETLKFDTLSGQQRGYQWFAASRWVQDVTAYAIGLPEGIEYLLQTHIKHIGKIGRNGFGRVKSIKVEAHTGNSEDWMIRTLPTGMQGKTGERYASVQACVRAPYWRKTDRVMAMEWVD